MPYLVVGERAECKIYGAYYSLPLLSVSEDGSTGVIDLPSWDGSFEGTSRELPIVTQAQRHSHDSCILLRDGERSDD